MDHEDQKSSWRTMILPFLERGNVYNRYDFTKPWNTSPNRRLATSFDFVNYHCPGLRDPAPDQTTYVLLTGPGTAFPGSSSTRFDDFRDGLSNTIIAVEATNTTIAWPEPRDIDTSVPNWWAITTGRPAPSCPHHRGRPWVLYADGAIGLLDPNLTPAQWRALTTIAGGEAFDPHADASP